MNLKNSIGFLRTLLVWIAIFVVLSLSVMNGAFKEGAGLSSGVSSFYTFLLSLPVSILFFLLLLGFSFGEIKKNSWKVFLLKILISVGVLISPLGLAYINGGYRSFTKGFLVRVDQECSEAELRDWALKFISENKHLPERYGEVTGEESIPDLIKALSPSGSYNFRWWMDEQDEPEFLEILWGGALPGHWGLRIGETGFKNATDSNTYVLQWKPGIYVWHGIDW